MRPTRRRFVEGIAATGLTATFAGYASAAGEASYVVRGGNAAAAAEDAGFTVRNELAGGQVVIVTGPEDAVDELTGQPGIAGAVRDVRVELPEPVAEVDEDGETAQAPAYEEYQWDKQVQNVAEAHEHATGAGTRLAIIDSGIDHTHPDLGNVDTASSATVVGGEISDHSGYTSDHGTHVAGITAGTGAQGVVGTAPDAELVSIRVFGEDGGAAFGDILLAVEYAAEIGADAANMSIGTDPIPPEANAQQYRGVMQPVMQHANRQGTFVVGSAGNSDANLQQGGRFTLPNSLQGVVSVSATAPNDLRAYYSNYGTNEVAVGAPGGAHEDLVETYCGYAEWALAGGPLIPSEDPREPGDETAVCFDEEGSIVVATDEGEDGAVECHPCTIPEWPYPFNLVYSAIPGSYGWKAGTSMAAPQVTGLAGLVRELAPDANANQVRNAIAQGAVGAQGRSSPDLGAGRTDALETVQRLQGGNQGGGQGQGQ